MPLLARAMLVQNEPKKVIEEFGKLELTTPEGRADLTTALAQANLVTGNVETARRLFADAQKIDARSRASDAR